MAIAQLHPIEQEQSALKTPAQRNGKTTGELIHEAVKQLLAQFQDGDRLRLLRQRRSMWKDRTDLPSVVQLRREWDRRQVFDVADRNGHSVSNFDACP